MTTSKNFATGNVSPIDFTCPRCKALVGEGCKGELKTNLPFHLPRQDKAAKMMNKIQGMRD